MDTATQNEAILAHLKAGKAVTPISALTMFGCLRLSARIYDLRAEGNKIDMQRVQDPKSGKYYGRYTLIKNKDSDHAKAKAEKPQA